MRTSRGLSALRLPSSQLTVGGAISFHPRCKKRGQSYVTQVTNGPQIFAIFRQASEPRPRSQEATAAEKAAKAKAAELERELCEANVKVEDLERELTKVEQSAKDAQDAKDR